MFEQQDKLIILTCMSETSSKQKKGVWVHYQNMNTFKFFPCLKNQFSSLFNKKFSKSIDWCTRFIAWCLFKPRSKIGCSSWLTNYKHIRDCSMFKIMVFDSSLILNFPTVIHFIFKSGFPSQNLITLNLVYSFTGINI